MLTCTDSSSSRGSLSRAWNPTSAAAGLRSITVLPPAPLEPGRGLTHSAGSVNTELTSNSTAFRLRALGLCKPTYPGLFHFASLNPQGNVFLSSASSPRPRWLCVDKHQKWGLQFSMPHPHWFILFYFFRDAAKVKRISPVPGF